MKLNELAIIIFKPEDLFQTSKRLTSTLQSCNKSEGWFCDFCPDKIITIFYVVNR